MLAGRISDKEMAEMNYQVDEEGRSPAEVAAEFLHKEKLLD
jgi:osmoprotectant transport system permease protein